MTFTFSDSVVLVTAGTSGLGLSVATKLVQLGANVVINYASNKDRADNALSHLQDISSKQDPSLKCIAIQADVTKKSEIERLVSETVVAMGRLDAVVSNAGWTKFANFHDLDDNVDEDVWDKCYAANVKSHLFLCHASRKYLEDAKGAFVMTSSVAGVKPSGSSIAYSVTKAAQIHLAKSLAMVMAPSIRVNAVSPGFMETNWIADFPESKVNEARDKTLLKRITQVEDVADQIILLIKSHLPLLPQELYNAISKLLEINDIKNLRVTCSTLARALPLHFDRVFISANSLNIQVFNAIANHEVFRHQVTEIIWDDARLFTGPELKCERHENEQEEERQDDVEDGSDAEDLAGNGCPFWFRTGRYDYEDTGTYEYPGPHLGIKESWAYYKPLLDDQNRVLASNADTEAFKYGLTRFTSLKRVTITPSTHGRLWHPLYRTPMIRAFPPGLDYPTPQAWPFYDDKKTSMCSHGFPAYRAKWRGFRLVTRALVEHESHGITELIIGGDEVQSGLNCRIFDEWSPEYGDLVSILKRPGFRYLDLHLFTGFIEDDHWPSYRSGLSRDAISQSKDLESLSIRATMDVSEGVIQGLAPDMKGYAISLRNIFSPESWPRLQHFSISRVLVDFDEFVDLLANMPPSLRFVEMVHVAFESPEQGYDDLVRAMRDVLDWRLRPIEERPKVKMVVSTWDNHESGYGRYIEIDQAVDSYIYGTGMNPFEDDKYWVRSGRGAVQRDLFDLDFNVAL
ncbi:hypothetical protein FLONG3_7152 [Fusarium longipes]|uniref:F-box domain-containing protein n=1 Tax=Fusarium longipes TaxID=694270 RepID=A0A395SG48_9HYPO|nr:hypothetical protein FLONG3_7152 [Fusarium longipes]